MKEYTENWDRRVHLVLFLLKSHLSLFTLQVRPNKTIKTTFKGQARSSLFSAIKFLKQCLKKNNNKNKFIDICYVKGWHDNTTFQNATLFF